jgi:glycosyltransferase involved in cell wall biosynthesis
MKRQTFLLFAYWHDCRWRGFVGASVKINDLAHNLASIGHNVVLFLPKNNFEKKQFTHKIVEIPFINLPFVRSISFNISLVVYLLVNLRFQNSAIVYVRRMNSIIPGLYAKMTKSVFIYEINDDPYHKVRKESSDPLSILRSIISIKQDELNLKLCDRALIITEGLLKKIIQYNPHLKAKKLQVMPSGANLELFKPLEKHQSRKKLKSKHSKIIGFAGTLLNHQGIDTLIKAAPSIIKKNPSVIFLILGEGPKKNEWIDLVTKQKLTKNFFFTGQIPYNEMPLWLGATDICVAPFHNNAGIRSPVKIFDYMACGKAVVASEIKGTTDIFSNRGAILLVEAEKPKALASAILDILNNDEKCQEMGRNGRKLITEKYDRRLIAEKISTVAKIVLNSEMSENNK